MARGKGEGTIYERRKGLWAAQLTLPDSKRKTFYGATRAEVLRKLTKAKQDVYGGLQLAEGQETLAQYLRRWLEMVEHDLKPGTLRTYRKQVRYITSGLRGVRLKLLTPQQVKLFYSQQVKRGLSPTTVNHIHGVLHKALEDALKMGLVQQNASDRVSPPRRADHEMITLSEDQARALLEAAQGERFEVLFWLALQTGMRQGELLGLRWPDVELDRASLVVRSSVQKIGKAFTLGEPKTAHSRRRIALSASMVEHLKSHRTNQKAEKVKAGPAWKEHELVFPNIYGGVMVPDNLAKRIFKRLLRKAALPDMRFHDLRHTAATLLLARGENPKVVSEMLGHADISITLRIYGHVTPTMQKSAASVMDTIFG